MPLYEIPRTIPDVANWSEANRAEVAGVSNAIIATKFPGGEYTWRASIVRNGDPNMLVCYHDAPSKDAVTEHATGGGFPVDYDTIKEVDEPDLSDALWTMGPENAPAQLAQAAE